MKTQSLLIILGLTLVGCGKSDPKLANAKPTTPVVTVTSENQRTLFPFAVGNSWNFAIEIQTQAANRPKESVSGEVQYKVTKTIPVANDGVKATIAVMQDGKKIDEQDWICDSKGIFQISMKSSNSVFTPRQPVIRFPVKDQDEFRWEGTGVTPIGKPGSMKYAFKNDGVQPNVDTDMGTMGALFMQTGGSFKTNEGVIGNLVVNSWFSPGVGLIRYRQVISAKGVNSSLTLRLKSYNVKK